MMKTDFIPVLIAIVSLLIGYGIGYLIRKLHWEKQAENARNDAQHLLENAHTKLDAIKAEVEVAKQTAKTVRQEAENNKKAQILEAKEEIRAYREQTENDLSKQRIELSHRDARLQQKEAVSYTHL
uniref:Rnase Y domain-containing protein n=1 Tax=Lactobacillus jensenii TaxID=109790 RepID=UPI001F08B545